MAQNTKQSIKISIFFQFYHIYRFLCLLRFSKIFQIKKINEIILYLISLYICLIFFCIGNKYRYISPLPAKLLFKVGKKDQVKFPIGVTTNSLEEILVADTGNHVVRLFDPEGKFLRDIGKEVPVYCFFILH